ncbi:MAG: hypothetical protein AVDCRST_MAG25-1447, partial [uncultured Rubrobacteraceae bacterium]
EIYSFDIPKETVRGPVRRGCRGVRPLFGDRGGRRDAARPVHGLVRRHALGDRRLAHRAPGGPEADPGGHPRGQRPVGEHDTTWHEPGAASGRV